MARLLSVLWLVGSVLAADPPGTPASRAALDACYAGRARNSVTDLETALAQAEAAVAADETDALAHFAVFCALGERMRLRGLSIRSLLELRRLRRTVDRTLELAPDFPDALVGKANLLLDAPRVVGGDAAEAERLLRRAVALDPDWVDARIDLARALERRGAREEAAREARAAMARAEAAGDAEARDRAAKLLEQVTP